MDYLLQSHLRRRRGWVTGGELQNPLINMSLSPDLFMARATRPNISSLGVESRSEWGHVCGPRVKPRSPLRCFMLGRLGDPGRLCSPKIGNFWHERPISAKVFGALPHAKTLVFLAVLARMRLAARTLKRTRDPALAPVLSSRWLFTET